jgi:hypothetical protein
MAEFAEPGFYLLTDTGPITEPADPKVLRLAMQELLPNAFNPAALAAVPDPVAAEPHDETSVKR